MAKGNKPQYINQKRESNKFGKIEQGNLAEAGEDVRDQEYDLLKNVASKDLFGALKISEDEKSALEEMPVQKLRNFCIDRLKFKFGKTHDIVPSNDDKRFDIIPKNGKKYPTPETIFYINDDKTVNVNISPYNNYNQVSYSTDKKPLTINQAFTEVYMFCARGATYLKKRILPGKVLEKEDPNTWQHEDSKFDLQEYNRILKDEGKEAAGKYSSQNKMYKFKQEQYDEKLAVQGKERAEEYKRNSRIAA